MDKGCVKMGNDADKEVFFMTTKVQKWGNSLGVRIPQKLAKKLAICDGSEVEISEGENGIMIKPVFSEPTLEELLSRVTDENRHDFVDWGKPEGKEIW